MKTPQELKSIFDKFPKEKIELKVEKVELTKITELEEYEYELDAGRNELMQYATDAREAIAKGVRELTRLDAVLSVAKKRLTDVQQQAKDLGVKIPQINQLEGAIKAFEQQKKSLTQVLK